MYRRKDTFYARAKAAGYRSRAAFKLLQLAARHRLFRRGNCVIEIGAWPGGWLQVAAQQVGATGKVIGVDLRPIELLPESSVVTIVGDIADPATQQKLVEACQGRAGVLLSDVAPSLSGVRDRDEAAAQALAECVLHIAGSVLQPGGKLVIKLFMSRNVQRFVTRLRDLFREVHLTRPDATRKESAEIYAVAIGFRGAAAKSVNERED